jgi:uncharacterized protein (DUF433 family)
VDESSKLPEKGRQSAAPAPLAEGARIEWMKTASALAYPHISTDFQVMSGRPCITGTRVRIMDIVGAYKAGVPDEQLQEYFSSRPLTLSEIHAALAYYYDHQEELETAFAEDEEIGQSAERERVQADH